ncbi:hypothetical protein [Burkholderia ubonensis]|uniref:hypothetical protein n=1 Tax=Burkholderia ubonensis TaxID=101571 RepID=UPI000AD0E4BF|nr:hypothetical protein [Burkholderia ubonensis]
MTEANVCEDLKHDEISFVDCVRRGKTSAPVHKSFARAGWEKAYEALRKDEACDALFWTGLSIFNALEALRKRYDTICGQPDIESYVRSLVGLGNLEQRSLHGRAVDYFESQGRDPTLNDVVELKLELDTGSHHGMEEISGVVVESLTKAIGERLREPRFDLRVSHLSTFQACALDTNICGVYRLLESLWQDCLWNGYAFTVADGVPGYTAAPTTEESGLDAVWRVLSEYRREMLRVSRASIASKEFSRLGPEEKSKRVPYRLVVSVEPHAKGHNFSFAAATEDRALDAAELAFLALDEINHDYYEEFLDQPISKLGGSCLRQLVAAWLIVRSISAVESAADVQPRVASSESLISFARVYSRQEIEEAVSFALPIGIDEARQLLNFMLFDGGDRQTLWTHPLILLPTGGVCLLAFAIEHANLRYVLERWLRYLDLNVSKKGNPFEQQVRRRLITMRRSKALSKNFEVLQSRFKFRAGVEGRESEDIDLVVVFGKTVVLGEVKCSITPTEPVDYFKNRKTISGAVAQIKKKSAFVEQNRFAFVKALAKRGMPISEDFRLIPLVVVNNPIYVGRVVDDVAVVDLLVLERYMAGFLIEGARFDCGGNMVADHELIFYNDLDEAQLHFESYLTGLPQLRLFLDGIRDRVVEIPVNSLVNFPRIAYRTFDVKIDKKKVSELHEKEARDSVAKRVGL